MGLNGKDCTEKCGKYQIAQSDKINEYTKCVCMDTFTKTEDNTSCECDKYVTYDQKTCVESCGDHQVGVYHEDIQATVCECEEHYT